MNASNWDLRDRICALEEEGETLRGEIRNREYTIRRLHNRIKVLEEDAPVDCSVCLEKVLRTDTQKLSCGCTVHSNCLKEHVATQMKGGETPKCFVLRKDNNNNLVACGAVITYGDLLTIAEIGQDAVTKLDRKYKLLSRSHFECTSPGCTGLLCSKNSSSKNSSKNRIQVCSRGCQAAAHCVMCHKAAHASNAGSGDCKASRMAMVEKTYLDLGADLAAGVKSCPNCWTPVSKTDGDCNAMTCSVCECRFCWLCGTVTVTPDEVSADGARDAHSMSHAHYFHDLGYLGDRPTEFFDRIKERQRFQCLKLLGPYGNDGGGRANMMYWKASEECAPWPDPPAPAQYVKPTKAMVELRVFGDVLAAP